MAFSDPWNKPHFIFLNVCTNHANLARWQYFSLPFFPSFWGWSFECCPPLARRFCKVNTFVGICLWRFSIFSKIMTIGTFFVLLNSNIYLQKKMYNKTWWKIWKAWKPSTTGGNSRFKCFFWNRLDSTACPARTLGALIVWRHYV